MDYTSESLLGLLDQLEQRVSGLINEIPPCEGQADVESLQTQVSLSFKETTIEILTLLK